jgi:hypothetical protein
MSALGDNHGYIVIWATPTINLTTLGIPETERPDFMISVDINDLIPGGGLPIARISNKCLDNSQNGTAGPNTLSNLEYLIDTTNLHVGWTTYRFNFPMPAGTKSIQPHFGVNYPAGPNGVPASKFAFDNFRIGFADVFIIPALCPIPIIGGAQNLPNQVIRWTNPQGAINADVYLQVSTVPISPSPNPRLTGTRIAHDINAESLTISSPLVVNRYYYWAVDVNMGEYVVAGFTWDFHTTNLNVEAGPTQYLVRTASPKTLILNATVTSDNAIATYAWTNITLATDKDPNTVVTIVSPTTEDTNVTLTNPTGGVTGYYQFTLTVTDVQGNIAADTVAVGVYGTCAAAAIADPNDYYDGVADFNGDCKVDFADFAIFAGKWLACDLLRRPCP